jgi:NADP-reducing hydrogenase subunit HndD
MRNIMKKIKIKINGKEYIAKAGQTVLEIARENNIFIPSLCYHPDIDTQANCRVCVVEVKGRDNLMTSCSLIAEDGMEILTNSRKVKKSRNTNLRLIFSAHIEKCSDCSLQFDCRLLSLARRYNIKITSFEDRKSKRKTYKFADAVEIDGSQCIDCRNCVEVCSKIQKINYLEIKGKGSKQEIVPTKNKNIDCIYCGQCALHCPVDAAQEQYCWPEIESKLKDKKKKVFIAIIAPSVRVTIGESFARPLGEDNSGRMVASLKKLGFDLVMDVNFGADLTTLVEAGELLERLSEKKSKLPMITSCCPAWVKYLEFYRPDLIPNLTTSRSPQIHLGGSIKTYWAEKMNIDPKDIVVVSIMPCTAKKFEIERSELKVFGNFPVDHVLTVRELSFLIKKNNIDFNKIKPSKTDSVISDPSGAALIYGASGGVMESALRTAHHFVCGPSCQPRIEFKEVRGSEGLREAEIDLDSKNLRVAIVNGIGNIKGFLDNIDKYDYAEVMACPGGCIGGGGQPIPSSMAIVKERTKGLYSGDKKKKIRTAHENKGAVEVFEWIKKNKLEKKVFHTKYEKKKRK